METRLKKLRSEMSKQKLDAVLISSVPNIIYLTNFSGFSTDDRDAFLFITKNDRYIFTHGIYKEAVGKSIKNFKRIEMRRENPVSKSLKSLVLKHKIKKIGVETFDLRMTEYERLLKFVNKKIIKPTAIINDLRIKKSSEEIAAIKNACVLGDKVYSTILQNIRINITEKELAFEIDLLIRKKGARPSFPTIVAFGANSSLPHHVPTNKKLSKNMFVLLDFGVKLNDYCSDMTRTILFGEANIEQKKAYNTVLESQQIAIQLFSNLETKKSKVLNAKKIDAVARKYIISKGFPSIPHSLGHGIGLEVHEAPGLYPHSKEALEDGMVFSIEPGIYLPDKFGVRIEDLFAIENNQLVPLTHSPKELIEI